MGNSFSPHNLPKRACALTLAGALALPLGAALAPAALAAETPAAAQAAGQPAASGPKLTVDTPNLDLIEGGTITVRGTGFTEQHREQDGSLAIAFGPRSMFVEGSRQKMQRVPNLYTTVIPKDKINADGSFEIQLNVPGNDIDPAKGPYSIGTFKLDVYSEYFYGTMTGVSVPLNTVTGEVQRLSIRNNQLNPVDKQASLTVRGLNFSNIPAGSTSYAQIVEVDANGKPQGEPLASKDITFAAQDGKNTSSFTSTLEYSGFKVDASKRYAYIVYNRHNGQVNEIARANLPVKDAQPRVKYIGETINTTKSYNHVSVWATNFRLDEGDSFELVLREKGTGTVVKRVEQDLQTAMFGDGSGAIVAMGINGSQVSASKQYEVTVSVKSQDPSRAISRTIDVPAVTSQQEVRKPKSRFVDMESSQRYYQSATWAVDQNVLEARDGRFSPSERVTRGQLVEALYRMAGSPDIQLPAQSPYRDISTSNPRYKAIVWARQQNIGNEYGDGSFHADDSVNRQTLVSFMYRAAGKPNVTLPKYSPFTDVRAGSNIYYRDMVWAQQKGVVLDAQSKEFNPRAQVSRAEAAQFLYQYANATRTR